MRLAASLAVDKSSTAECPLLGCRLNSGRLLLTLSSSQFDPYRKSRLLTNGRCHVAKYWGRKTFIALNRYAVERGSRLLYLNGRRTLRTPLEDSQLLPPCERAFRRLQGYRRQNRMRRSLPTLGPHSPACC